MCGCFTNFIRKRRNPCSVRSCRNKPIYFTNFDRFCCQDISTCTCDICFFPIIGVIVVIFILQRQSKSHCHPIIVLIKNFLTIRNRLYRGSLITSHRTIQLNSYCCIIMITDSVIVPCFQDRQAHLVRFACLDITVGNRCCFTCYIYVFDCISISCKCCTGTLIFQPDISLFYTIHIFWQVRNNSFQSSINITGRHIIGSIRSLIECLAIIRIRQGRSDTCICVICIQHHGNRCRTFMCLIVIIIPLFDNGCVCGVCCISICNRHFDGFHIRNGDGCRTCCYGRCASITYFISLARTIYNSTVFLLNDIRAFRKIIPCNGFTIRDLYPAIYFLDDCSVRSIILTITLSLNRDIERLVMEYAVSRFTIYRNSLCYFQTAKLMCVGECCLRRRCSNLARCFITGCICRSISISLNRCNKTINSRFNNFPGCSNRKACQLRTVTVVQLNGGSSTRNSNSAICTICKRGSICILQRHSKCKFLAFIRRKGTYNRFADFKFTSLILVSDFNRLFL